MPSAGVVKPREKWKNKVDFLFGVAGASVGLGNIWRFPYLCYKNGGGAFLIPYLISLLLAALPIFFLEVTLGQYTSRGVAKAWCIVPLMKGLGYASTVIIIHLNTYYMTVLAWALRYTVACFNKVLPWSTCNNTWNTENCYVFGVNNSMSTEDTNATKVSSVYEYWDQGVLGRTSGLHDLGSVQWPIFWCMLVGWLITYFCIWKGIKWTSKAVYFTASFPLLMLIILLVRGVTLDGAEIGIQYYLTPNATRLLEPQVWMDAATQVFYSYSLCNGIVVALGSYNVYNHNIYRDTIYFALINSGTSFISGFAVFSVLGYMAKEENVSIAEVADSGPGLVFQAYPRAVALLPLPQLWGALFFLMLFFLGLDSQFVGQESLIASLRDMKPSLFAGKWRREIIIALICFVQFLVGILLVTQGGIYIFNVYDNYAAAGWALFFIGILECVAIAWIYGANKFWQNICDMLGYTPRISWYKYAWMFFAPVYTSVVFFYALATYEPLTYNNEYVYSPGGQAFAWLIALSAMVWVPGYAIYAMCTARGRTLKEKWAEVTSVPPKVELRLKKEAHDYVTGDSVKWKEAKGSGTFALDAVPSYEP